MVTLSSVNLNETFEMLRVYFVDTLPMEQLMTSALLYPYGFAVGDGNSVNECNNGRAYLPVYTAFPYFNAMQYKIYVSCCITLLLFTLGEECRIKYCTNIGLQRFSMFVVTYSHR